MSFRTENIVQGQHDLKTLFFFYFVIYLFIYFFLWSLFMCVDRPPLTYTNSEVKKKLKLLFRISPTKAPKEFFSNFDSLQRDRLWGSFFKKTKSIPTHQSTKTFLGWSKKITFVGGYTVPVSPLWNIILHTHTMHRHILLSLSYKFQNMQVSSLFHHKNLFPPRFLD